MIEKTTEKTNDKIHVIWKRPDGFHDSKPSDFEIVSLGSHSKIWLHKTNKDWFPFQISGGWQEDEGTRKLNCMINLINHTDSDWVKHLVNLFHKSEMNDPVLFIRNLGSWTQDLIANLKGDKWEKEIMTQALYQIQKHIEKVEPNFLKGVYD